MSGPNPSTAVGRDGGQPCVLWEALARPPGQPGDGSHRQVLTEQRS